MRITWRAFQAAPSRGSRGRGSSALNNVAVARRTETFIPPIDQPPETVGLKFWLRATPTSRSRSAAAHQAWGYLRAGQIDLSYVQSARTRFRNSEQRPRFQGTRLQICLQSWKKSFIDRPVCAIRWFRRRHYGRRLMAQVDALWGHPTQNVSNFMVYYAYRGQKFEIIYNSNLKVVDDYLDR